MQECSWRNYLKNSEQKIWQNYNVCATEQFQFFHFSHLHNEKFPRLLFVIHRWGDRKKNTYGIFITLKKQSTTWWNRYRYMDKFTYSRALVMLCIRTFCVHKGYLLKILLIFFSLLCDIAPSVPNSYLPKFPRWKMLYEIDDIFYLLKCKFFTWNRNPSWSDNVVVFFWMKFSTDVEQ